MTSIVNNIVESSVNRVVSGYQPGIGKRDFQSTARTFGELKEELRAQGFNLNNVRVSEGNTQIDLVNDDAILPTNIQKRGQITNDLIIIMTPKEKPKSGAIDPKTASYKELKAEIKELCNGASKDKAKAHFGNYTQSSTDTMRSNLTSWYKKNGKVSEATAKESPKTSAKPASQKFEKVRENLEKGNYEKVVPTVDREAFDEALGHILYGIQQLQNLIPNEENTTPSEDELAEMARKFSR